MRGNTRLLLLGLAVGAALLAGCTEQPGDQPQQTPDDEATDPTVPDPGRGGPRSGPEDTSPSGDGQTDPPGTGQDVVTET